MRNYENRKIEEYNIIRVIATILVVIGHAGYISPMTEYGGMSFGEYGIPLSQQLVDLLIRVIYSFHMPLFFALSGAVFYLNVKDNKFPSFITILSKKAKRLLVPYVLCTFLWNIPIKLMAGYWNGSINKIKDIFGGQFLLFGNSHLWFLWALFVITLIIWIFRNNVVMRLLVSLLMFGIGCVVDISAFGLSKILLNIIWFEIGFEYGSKRKLIYDCFNRQNVKAKLCIVLASILQYLIILVGYLKVAKGNEAVSFRWRSNSLDIYYRCRRGAFYRDISKQENHMGKYQSKAQNVF